MVFDADYSNVSPGFRFGFPVIEPSYYNPLTEQFSCLMVTPSGARVEFRQTAASNVYETADLSYAQLTVIPGQQNQGTEYSTLLIRTTDGTMMTYLWRADSYRLSEIKDRNGNYISVVHDARKGLLQSMTDTLGRAVTVEYHNDFAPIAIKQNWKDNNGTGEHLSLVQNSAREISADCEILGIKNGQYFRPHYYDFLRRGLEHAQRRNQSFRRGRQKHQFTRRREGKLDGRSGQIHLDTRRLLRHRHLGDGIYQHAAYSEAAFERKRIGETARRLRSPCRK